MSLLRDQRTPAETAAAVEICRQHAWPWLALQDAVRHLSEDVGLTPAGIAEQLRVPWSWIATQFTAHDMPLPYHVRAHLRRAP